MNKDRLITLSLIILAAAASRLLPHPENVAPIAAIALFAGAKFENKALAFAVPALAMLLSDAFIGFYSGMWVTYMAFAAIVCIGFLLRRKQDFSRVALATVAGSVLFFLVTNFALWSSHGLYPQTLDGIMQSYTAALPFFRNSLLGDAFYTALLFGGFALAERRFSRLQTNLASA
jgi:hypothetical protein